MKRAPSRLRFSDCILTMDACHWFSPSYQGMSPRSELWLVTLLYIILCLGPGLWLEAHSPLARDGVALAADLLIFFPLYIRRGRQMGSIAWGLMPLVPGLLLQLTMLQDYIVHGCDVNGELLGVFPSAFTLFVALPLYLCGGYFSGRKNELHRAAIAGDRARAEEVVAFFPSAPGKRSEKGRLASEYAERRNHHELAAWLRELEKVPMGA